VVGVGLGMARLCLVRQGAVSSGVVRHGMARLQGAAGLSSGRFSLVAVVPSLAAVVRVMAVGHRLLIDGATGELLGARDGGFRQH